MQDSMARNRDGIPVLSRIPALGDAFSFRNDTATKTELVIFLGPVVMHEASVDGDLKSYRSALPDAAFFQRNHRAPVNRDATQRGKD